MNDQADKISVIIPVYKVEREIERCIESVRKQTYRNLEIILVDDGSPDCCPEICDAFKKKDERIRVIHKENGGLSDARNFGLDVADGDFISFVDSDDWVDDNFLETLHNAAVREDADIAIIGYRMIWDSGKVRTYGKENEYCVFDQHEALKEILIQRKFQFMVCTKLYKKNIFDHIRFPVGKIYEDAAVGIPTFLEARKVVFCGDPKYNYYQKTESIVHSRFSTKKLVLLNICAQIIQYTEDINDLVLEAHTLKIKVLLSFILESAKFSRTQEDRMVTLGLIERLKKEKKYIRNNPYLEPRKIIVIDLILNYFPLKILVFFWNKRVEG